MSKYLKPGIYRFGENVSYWRIFEDYHEISDELDFTHSTKYQGKQEDCGNFIIIDLFTIPITTRFQMILNKK